ncbi:MAG: glutamyl-tRNA reductase [Planctomycetaceae bacterium]
MNFHVIYCNHRTADLAVRERLAFSSEAQFGHVYERWRRSFPESELVVLSTCNRVELYAARPDDLDGPTPREIVGFLADFHGLPEDAFANRLLERHGPDAVRHLFEVACSLDSMVLGEPQIVAQVKEAYERAYRHETCGPLTNALFQMAFRVSGRVRTETALSEGRVSIASVAVGEFGRGIFDRFDDKTVLVIGAGAMAEETVRYLADAGVTRFVVVNRNPERAEQLAATWGGTARPFEMLDDALAKADVVVAATGAQDHVVTAERFRAARRRSAGKPIFILDLGAPRDFDPKIAGIDQNTFLYDIDDLKATCDANRALRQKEIERARRIIDDETDRFVHEIYHRATGPVIQRLRDEWHAIRQQEVDQLFAKLPHLPDRDRLSIERTIERIVNKLLHPPLEVLKDEAKDGPPHGLLDALRRLFRLPE